MKPLSQMKALIVGLGQIGGSLGLDLVEYGIVSEVIGYDRDPTVVSAAGKRQAIHSVARSLKDGISRADLIILATPIRRTIKMIPSVCRLAGPERAILDVAGTKRQILKAVNNAAKGTNYISGHPLAGNERCGIEAADNNKFRDRPFVLVPMVVRYRTWLSNVKQLVGCLGAVPMIMSADEHDRLIALTSNMPYLLSIVLMDLALESARHNRRLWRLTGGSFTGATRVAASSVDLSLDMFLTNSDEITGVIDRTMDKLLAMKKLLQAGDERRLRALIRRTHRKSRTLHG
ncbi:MAG: prephenate dehydrogenase/arogenate dehydrogenase family protein [bacterium]